MGRDAGRLIVLNQNGDWASATQGPRLGCVCAGGREGVAQKSRPLGGHSFMTQAHSTRRVLCNLKVGVAASSQHALQALVCGRRDAG